MFRGVGVGNAPGVQAGPRARALGQEGAGRVELVDDLPGRVHHPQVVRTIGGEAYPEPYVQSSERAAVGFGDRWELAAFSERRGS